jgi:hypothetical protein
MTSTADLPENRGLNEDDRDQIVAAAGDIILAQLHEQDGRFPWKLADAIPADLAQAYTGLKGDPVASDTKRLVKEAQEMLVQAALERLKTAGQIRVLDLNHNIPEIRLAPAGAGHQLEQDLAQAGGTVAEPGAATAPVPPAEAGLQPDREQPEGEGGGPGERRPPVAKKKPEDKRKRDTATRKASQPATDNTEADRLVPPPSTQPNPAADAGAGTADRATAGHSGPPDLDDLRAFARSFGYDLHPIVFVPPPMRGADYKALMESIRRVGLKVRILTWQGAIIDGLHRLRACMALGITPAFVEWDGEGSLAGQVAALNGPRRHSTPSLKAVMAVELLPWLGPQAKERQRLHGQTAPGRASRTVQEKILTVTELGAAVGGEHAAKMTTEWEGP